MVEIKNFGKQLFLNNYWGIDFLAALLFSIAFGSYIQVAADSGQKNNGKIVLSILISTFSYLATYIISLLPVVRRSRYPSWLFISAIGSIFYSFIRMVVYFMVVNWDPNKNPDSLFEYLARLLPGVLSNFVLAAILFSLLVLICIFGLRFVVISARELNRSKTDFE